MKMDTDKIRCKIREDWEEKFKDDPALSNDKYLPFGKIDKHVTNFIEENKIEPPKRVLDLGCGNGRNTLYLVEKGFEAYGIDCSKYAIEFSKKHVKKAKFVICFAQDLPFSNNFFECIIDAGTIHVNPPLERESIINEIYRVLEIGGLFHTRLFINSKIHRREFVSDICRPTFGFNLGDIFDLFQGRFEILKIKISMYYVEPVFFVSLKKRSSPTFFRYNLNQIHGMIEYDWTKY